MERESCIRGYHNYWPEWRGILCYVTLTENDITSSISLPNWLVGYILLCDSVIEWQCVWILQKQFFAETSSCGSRAILCYVVKICTSWKFVPLECDGVHFLFVDNISHCRYAFALEETNYKDEAERLSHKALSLDPVTPIALHTLSKLYCTLHCCIVQWIDRWWFLSLQVMWLKRHVSHHPEFKF